MNITVIGHPVSPYVRKVLACLEYKGLSYSIDPVLGPMANSHFTKISPLRLIPVLKVGNEHIADSSVICQFLDDQYPQKAVYPKDPQQAAQARWLEEFADTKLFEVLVQKLFVHRVLRPVFKTGKPDLEVVKLNIETSLPEALDYLEPQMPTSGYALGEMSMADITLGAFFRLIHLSDYTIDADRWPRLTSYLKNILSLTIFTSRYKLEQALLVLPFEQHWAIAEQQGYMVTKGSSD